MGLYDGEITVNRMVGKYVYRIALCNNTRHYLNENSRRSDDIQMFSLGPVRYVFCFLDGNTVGKISIQVFNEFL